MPSEDQSRRPLLVQPDPSRSREDGTSSQTERKSEAEPPRKRQRKIAILGTAPESVDLAPYDDPSWEVWTCSGLALQHKRTDAHFELHEYNEVARGWTGNPEHDAQMAEHYFQTLAQFRPPQVVYLKRADPRIPVSRAYPVEAVFEAFPERYFASTVSYMIALAILEGATEIGLWGVDMALSSEQYSGQRASCEWLLGIARGQGITVTIPPEGDLLKLIEPYAFGTNSDGLRKVKAKKLAISQRLKEAEAQRKHLDNVIAGYTGALDGLDYVARCWQADG